MLRLVFALSLAVVVGPACTVTTLDDDDDDGGEGEGEGEGEGGCVAGPEDNDAACGDGCDNDDDNFVDCDDFDCQNNTPLCSEDVGVVPIQAVQDETVAIGSTASVESVFVTAVNVSDAGNITLFIQEPAGEGNGHTYPQFAALGVFVASSSIPTLAGITDVAPGDCINLSGKTGEFNGLTQLSFITAFSVAAACGTEPSPTIVPLLSIATDTDPELDLAQAGVDAEALEAVLVAVETVTASTASDTNGFNVVDAGGARLEISDFLLGTGPNVAVDDTFTSITGVLGRFDAFFKMQPRTEADIVR